MTPPVHNSASKEKLFSFSLPMAFQMVTILGALLAVYVQMNTRIAVLESQINDMSTRLIVMDTARRDADQQQRDDLKEVRVQHQRMIELLENHIQQDKATHDRGR